MRLCGPRSAILKVGASAGLASGETASRARVLVARSRVRRLSSLVFILRQAIPVELAEFVRPYWLVAFRSPSPRPSPLGRGRSFIRAGTVARRKGSRVSRVVFIGMEVEVRVVEAIGRWAERSRS